MRKALILFLFIGLFSFAQESPIKTYTHKNVIVESYDFKTFESFLKFDDDTTYIINFWATWCAPCIKELPDFEKINENYKDKKVKVILVSLDMPSKVESNLIPFMIRKKLQSQVILLDDPDYNSWIEKVDKNWSGSIPATVIYNKKNRKFYEQTFTYETLEKELLTFIN